MRQSAAVTKTRASKRNGLFITFEGIEGSGKTTQLTQVAEVLRRQGFSVVTTREPGGTALGLQLRRVLLDFGEPMDAKTELLLMFADRRQHLIETIVPALERGEVVLCDRYTDASVAYQGGGRGLGEHLVGNLHQKFCGIWPERTYLLDCPVDVAQLRLGVRQGDERDRIEREGTEFHEKVREAYRRAARRDAHRIVVLDGAASPDEVCRDIFEDLEPLLGRYQKRRAKRP